MRTVKFADGTPYRTHEPCSSYVAIAMCSPLSNGSYLCIYGEIENMLFL